MHSTSIQGHLLTIWNQLGTVTCQWLGVPCQKWTVISNRILLETRIHSKAIFNSKNGRHSAAHTFYFVFMRAIDVKQATERGGSDYAGKQLRMSSNKYRFPIEFYWKYAEFYWKIWKTQSRPHAKLHSVSTQGHLLTIWNQLRTVTCQWLGVPCQKWTVISNRILLGILLETWKNEKCWKHPKK